MKILLMKPPRFDATKFGKGFNSPSAPGTGLACLSAYLKANGKEVILCDAHNWSWPQVNFFLMEHEFSVVGVTCWTEERPNAFRVVSMAKAKDKSIITVLGGSHATHLDRQILENYPDVDFIVRGEGEITMLDLVNRLENGGDFRDSRGLSFRYAGEYYRTDDRERIQDLDTLPMPDYESIDYEQYATSMKLRWQGEGKYITMVTSRGCTAACKFCSTKPHWGARYTQRSAEKLIEEIDWLYHNRQMRKINFADDTFTVNKARAIGVCKMIIERGYNLKIDMNARIDTVDDEMAGWLVKVGVNQMQFGVESGSDRMLEAMNKHQTVKQIRETFAIVRGHGIACGGLFVIGFPGETRETVKETIALIKSIPISWGSIGASILMLYPATQAYNDAVASGWISDQYWLENDGQLPAKYYTKEHDLKTLHHWRNCMYGKEILQ